MNKEFTELKIDVIAAPDEYMDKGDIPETGDCGTFYNNGCDYQKKPDGKIKNILRMVLGRWK